MSSKNIQLLKIFNFLIGFSLFAPLAIIYFAKVSGSYALGASIFGIIMLSAAIFEVPTGIWSDKVGRRGTIILGSWARVIAFLLYALASSYWWLVAGAIFYGLSRSLYSGNNDAFLHDTLTDDGLESEFDEYLGKTSSTEQLAMGLSALLGGIIGNYSFAYLLWLSVIPQIFMLGISYRFTEPRSHTKSDTNIYAHILEAIRLFIHNKKLRLLSIGSILTYAMGEIRWEFTSAFTATVWPLWATGISRTLPSFGASVSFFYSGKLIRKFSEANILLFGNIVGKFTSLIAYGFPTILSPIIMAIPSVVYGAETVAEKTLMQQEFTRHQRATMSSLNSLGGSIGFFLMSLILGGMADALGPAKALYIITLISTPIIYLYYLLFKNDRKIKI